MTLNDPNFKNHVNWKSGLAITSLVTVPSVLAHVIKVDWVLLVMIELDLQNVLVAPVSEKPPVRENLTHFLNCFIDINLVIF